MAFTNEEPAWTSLKWHDRTSYEGVVQDSNCHGLGVAKFPDGSKYEGEWSRGKMHGFGVYTWKDGSTYKGKWDGGNMQGCAAWTSVQGNQPHEGQFMSNQFVGGGLACPIETARFAANEADICAGRARGFEP